MRDYTLKAPEKPPEPPKTVTLRIVGRNVEKVSRPKGEKLCPGTRGGGGTSKGWTDRTRRTARRWCGFYDFKRLITLAYDKRPSEKELRRNMESLKRWLRRAGVSCFVVIEFSDQGEPHFHLGIASAPHGFLRTISDYWQKGSCDTGNDTSEGWNDESGPSPASCYLGKSRGKENPPWWDPGMHFFQFHFAVNLKRPKGEDPMTVPLEVAEKAGVSWWKQSLNGAGRLRRTMSANGGHGKEREKKRFSVMSANGGQITSEDNVSKRRTSKGGAERAGLKPHGNRYERVSLKPYGNRFAVRVSPVLERWAISLHPPPAIISPCLSIPQGVARKRADARTPALFEKAVSSLPPSLSGKCR